MEDPTKKYIQLQIETLKKTITELQATVDEIDSSQDTTAKSTESSNDPDIESANVAKVDVNSPNSNATLQTEDQTLSNASEDTQDDTTVKFTESSCLDDPDIESANVAKVDVNSSNVTATLQDEDQTQKEAILSPRNLAGATEDGQDITDTEMNQDGEESTDDASVCEADLNPHSRHEQMMCNLTKEISSLEALGICNEGISVASPDDTLKASGICNEGISVASPEQFTIDKFDFDDSSESSSMQTASSTMNCNLGILDTNLEAIARYYPSFWDLMINNQTPGKTVLLQYEKWHGVEPNSSMRKKKLGRLFKPNGKIPGKQLLETKRSVEVKLGVTFHSLLHFLLSIDAIGNFGYGSKVLISEQTELEWEEMNEVEQTAVNWAGLLLVDMRSLAQRRQRNAIRASKELKRKCCDLSV